jgi:hypothetical protein
MKKRTDDLIAYNNAIKIAAADGFIALWTFAVAIHGFHSL